MQLLLAAVLIDALHAAFEDREEAFDRIGGYVAARVFLVRMVDRLMRRELATDRR
jgi:hypothetical protein